MSGAVRARAVPSLVARVATRTPLLYSAGPDASLDRPAHVRAGSALARLAGGRLAVVQDDASFVAILGAGRVDAVVLPSADGVRQFDDRRGNKKQKLDLEASLVLGDALVAFGSGSSAARERVVMVRGEGAERVDIVEAPELYAAMRSLTAFSGSELNVEGAAQSGEDVVFFQRGNGAGAAVDATARVSAAELLCYLRREGPCPLLREVVQWDLGAAGGTRLTFTDGAAGPGGLAFLACAEASPDATRDGPVSGVALGRLDDRAREAQLAAIEDEAGAPLLDKCEGLAFSEAAGRAWVVVDKDDPDAPSELLELRLGPGWQRR
jgi:hypothetical protein